MPDARALTDRYDFLAELGRGGMGIVYLARDRATGLSVAIKLLGAVHAGNAEAALRFAREARTVAALDHPHIVRTLAIEELSGRSTAIVSEYVPGKSLRTLLREAGALSFDETASVLRDVASALAYAHGFRIVHRDVKPENIVIEETSGRALLADFGIARPLDSDTQLTMAGSSLGTPSYMAPEQVRGGKVDVSAAVYALGLVGWEMLTGVRPWEGETLYEVLHKQQHERLPSLAELRPEIPAYLLLAIEGAIAKRPRDRWADGGEFLARLSPTPGVLPARRNPDEEWTEAETVPVPLPVPLPSPAAAVDEREPRAAVNRSEGSRATLEPLSIDIATKSEPLQPLSIDIVQKTAPPQPAAADVADGSSRLEPLEITIARTDAAPSADAEHAEHAAAAALPSFADHVPPETAIPPVPVTPASPMDDALRQPPQQPPRHLESGDVRSRDVSGYAAWLGATPDAAKREVHREVAQPTVARRRRMSLAGPLLALVATVVIALMVLNGKQGALVGDSAIAFPQTKLDTARRDTAQGVAANDRTAPDIAAGGNVSGNADRNAAASGSVRGDGGIRRDSASGKLPAAPPAGRVSTPSSPPASRNTPAPRPRTRTAPPARTGATSSDSTVRAPSTTSSRNPAADGTTAGRDARCSVPTNDAQRACLIAEIDRNDAELTRTYQALIGQMRRAAGGVREPPAVQRLRAEQRAWIDRRDRACRPGGAVASGALWGAERIPCFARMSGEREEVLRRRLESQGNRG